MNYFYSRLDRSSSGSSHGSGSGSGNNSSGYQSEVSEVRTIQERCQVELEDSDPEDQSQVVTVTGGLRVGPGAGQGAFTSQVSRSLTSKDENNGDIWASRVPRSEIFMKRSQWTPEWFETASATKKIKQESAYIYEK